MKDWHEIRKQGKTAYVIKHGVLFWGLLTAVIVSAALYYIQPGDPVWRFPLIAAIVFPFIGYFVGLSFWQKSEKRYHESEAAMRPQ